MAVEWAQVESGSIDQVMEDVIKFCCMQIIIKTEKYNDKVLCEDWCFSPKSSTHDCECRGSRNSLYMTNKSTSI